MANFKTVCRVGELVDFCAGIGLDKIETTGR